LGEKWPVNLAFDYDFHVNHRVLLHAANLRYETHGFTYPPKEGMLWIFSPEKSDRFGRVRTRELGTIVDDVTGKQIIWYGRVVRMDPMRLPKIMINWKPEVMKN
jgi:hypothetical protein